MDQERQIRLLIPPFFLYASLLFAAGIDPTMRSHLLGMQREGVKDILPLVTVIGVITIPLGFLIGTMTILLLRAGFAICRWFSGDDLRMYEASLTERCFRRITRRAGLRSIVGCGFLLQAAATFDHEFLPPGIHQWLLRRWSAFNTSVNSAVALLLALLLVSAMDICAGCLWFLANSALVCVLLIHGCMAWSETMRMIEFQSARPVRQGEPHASVA